MKYTKLIFTMLTAFSLLACAQSSSSGASPNEPEKVSYSIDGKTPAEYYEQFLFRAEPCVKGYLRDYRFMSSNIGSLNSDRAYTFYVRVYLFPDSTYIAELTQMKPSDRWAGSHVHIKEFEQAGLWKIEGAEIVLEGLGRGQPETYNGSAGFYLTLQNVKADPMFNGSSTNFRRAHSTSVLQRLESSCW